MDKKALEEALNRALKEGYSQDYKNLIERYFKTLESDNCVRRFKQNRAGHPVIDHHRFNAAGCSRDARTAIHRGEQRRFVGCKRKFSFDINFRSGNFHRPDPLKRYVGKAFFHKERF